MAMRRNKIAFMFKTINTSNKIKSMHHFANDTKSHGPDLWPEMVRIE